MHLSKSVNYPHPNKDLAGDRSRPLLEKVDGITVGPILSDTALDIARVVRDSLWFESGINSISNLTPEGIAARRTTNCYGHTIILSECLEQAEIPHNIGYINGHTLSIVSNPYDGSTWIIDAQAPEVSGPIDEATGNQLDKTPEGSERPKVSLFSTTRYLHGLANPPSLVDILQKYPWLSPSKSSIMPRSSRETNDEHSIDISKKSVLVTYTAEAGRQTIYNYARFQTGIYYGDFTDAYFALCALADNYPELDARQPQRQAGELVRGLVAEGSVERAISSLAIINSATAFSKDPRGYLWLGDQFRWIGLKTHAAYLAECALMAYGVALSRTQYPAQIIQKIQKTEKLIAKLA